MIARVLDNSFFSAVSGRHFISQAAQGYPLHRFIPKLKGLWVTANRKGPQMLNKMNTDKQH